MKRLTLQKLKEMKEGEVFAQGIVPNSPQGIFATRDGGNIKWLAVRGQIHDWAIYYGRPEMDDEIIHYEGDKLFDKLTIKRLVHCDPEAFDMYRY